MLWVPLPQPLPSRLFVVAELYVQVLREMNDRRRSAADVSAGAAPKAPAPAPAPGSSSPRRGGPAAADVETGAGAGGEGSRPGVQTPSLLLGFAPDLGAHEVGYLPAPPSVRPRSRPCLPHAAAPEVKGVDLDEIPVEGAVEGVLDAMHAGATTPYRVMSVPGDKVGCASTVLLSPCLVPPPNYYP